MRMNRQGAWILLRRLARDGRENLRLSQAEAARKSGHSIDHSTISRLESGKSFPHKNTLRVIFEVIESGLDAEQKAQFLLAAKTLGRDLMAPSSSADTLREGDELEFPEMIVIARDLKVRDIVRIQLTVDRIKSQSEERPRFSGAEQYVLLGRYEALGAATHLEDVSANDYEKGLVHARAAMEIALDVGDDFLHGFAWWNKAILARKQADVHGPTTHEYAYGQASQLSEQTSFPAITAMACQEAAKYWMEKGDKAHFYKWIAQAEQAAWQAIEATSRKLGLEDQYFPSYPAHVFACVYDAKLQGQARFGASVIALKQTAQLARYFSDGLSINIDKVTLELTLAEGILRWTTRDEREAREEALIQWWVARRFAKLKGMTKQVMKAKRIIRERRIRENLRQLDRVEILCERCQQITTSLHRLDEHVFRCIKCGQLTIDASGEDD